MAFLFCHHHNGLGGKISMRNALCLVALVTIGIFGGSLSSGQDGSKVRAAGVRDSEDGWRALFNGKDLEGWEGVNSSITTDWKIVNGVLEGHGSGGGWIIDPGEYKNFRRKIEFRVEKEANSGVFLRAPRTSQPHVDGLEIQILDDSAKKYAEVDNAKRCGSLMLEVGPSKQAGKKPGEWQQMEIECNASRVSVVLNGEKSVDVDLAKTEPLEEHPGRKRTHGHIGLQDHGERVDFRKVLIKENP